MAAAARLTEPLRTSPDGKDAGPAGLQEQRRRGLVAERGGGNAGAGEQESAAVFGELTGQPAGPGLSTDEDEQPADRQFGIRPDGWRG